MATDKRSRVTSSRSAPGKPAPKSSQGGYGHDSEPSNKDARLPVKKTPGAANKKRA